MKAINYELRYDGATAAQVYAMLQDPAFREQVCDFQRVQRRTVSITAAGEGMSVKLDQVQAARGIPSFAKKLVGEEINIVQTGDIIYPWGQSSGFKIPEGVLALLRPFRSPAV